MASSRSFSPTSGGGSPERLSPRSKIKALLAAVDSSEDEATVQHRPRITHTPSPGAQHSPSRTGNEMTQMGDTEDDSDVDMRPRGRLAARMLAAAPKTEHNDHEYTENVDMADLEEDEDQELPTVPRRLKRKSSRNATPIAESAPRSPTPGLFVSSLSRHSPTKTANNDSDSENDLPAVKSDRFKALVERKKQERLAREAADEAKKAEQRVKLEKLASELSQLDSDNDNVSDITDDEGGRRLTQTARPSQRKAGKKAIEEMNRETQRMQRSMQLAHEAKTRKKISKSSLFERFNFRPNGEPELKTASSSRPGSSHSNAAMKEKDTPPSSPPVEEKQESMEEDGGAQVDLNFGDELPELNELMAATQPKVDKGKGKEVLTSDLPKSTTKLKRHVRVKLPQPSVNLTAIDFDDELEITTTPKDKIDALFNRVPAKKDTESHSLQALRALAQLKSPGKECGRGKKHVGMGAGELQTYLQQKARQQAKLERHRRLETLKAQGVVVQTAAERERQLQEVEDIVAKARQEADDIMKQERAEAKKNKDGEENDPLAWDDSEDDEYEVSADEADLSEVDLSGSEDEAEAGEDEDEKQVENPIFDDAESGAEEPTEPSHYTLEDEDVGDDVENVFTNLTKRRPRHQTTVLSDDEEDVVEATPRLKSTASPKIPTSGGFGSVLRSAKKTFIPGLPVEGAAGLGLTQIFAGTMDDSQMTPSKGPALSLVPDFDNFPDSNFSATMDATMEESEYGIAATQVEETQDVQLNFSQSQMRGLDSLFRDDMPDTQISDMIEPSQDGGFQEHTPLKSRFMSQAPQSTVDTVLVDREGTPHDSPPVRRGRLRRKIDTMAVDEDELVPTAIASTDVAPTAFKALVDGAKKEQKEKFAEDFNRKKSKAKEMVEEQAYESEDEYQGLGGADGEDSDDDSVASVKDMIDDAAGNDLDERKLAAFYADRERANDEQAVEKLFKDIQSGMLRRKRGADYDLSDSDDGGEARRRMKRRQFAKMQKALFSDERVKKMAENPGNQAFLKTMEDQGSDDEMDFLGVVEEPAQDNEDSQSQFKEEPDIQQQIVPDSQTHPVLNSAAENRAPAHLRRTKNGKKPANIGEVRETLSNLLDDDRKGSFIPATEAGSDSEEEEKHEPSARSKKENCAQPPRDRNAVVDRITLSRNPSSTSSATSSRQAFTAASSSSFKVPALLRRATTNSFKSTSSTGLSAQTTGGGSSAGSFGDDAKIKKAAGKKSGINSFARENEGRAKMMESERRREERKVKGAEKRIGVVGSLLGKGSFE